MSDNILSLFNISVALNAVFLVIILLLIIFHSGGGGNSGNNNANPNNGNNNANPNNRNNSGANNGSNNGYNGNSINDPALWYQQYQNMMYSYYDNNQYCNCKPNSHNHHHESYSDCCGDAPHKNEKSCSEVSCTCGKSDCVTCSKVSNSTEDMSISDTSSDINSGNSLSSY